MTRFSPPSPPLRGTTFNESWRRRKSEAFELVGNSTTGTTKLINLWNRPTKVYSNANLSVYSAQTCNARCTFCVEELRPASRGTDLWFQKKIERDDEIYFAALEATLTELRALNPSVSVTGGEASKDPRLPRILRTLATHDARKRTLTTNGSGLLDVREGKRVIDWLVDTGLQHLNISKAHPDYARNAQLMKFTEGLSDQHLQRVVHTATTSGVRIRLSCVLLKEAINDFTAVFDYLDYAASLGVDNVIFRQLMETDPQTHSRNRVVEYCDQQRVRLEPILDEISSSSRFTFQRQIVGYYYYVEVWRYKNIDVVFEEADLARLEQVKQADPETIHELVFHPNGRLASTWQPWDGILGPQR
ncbi:MAG: hypothetical protein K2W95_22985 [Candidatus Obscuribacterales bacterium]|nr:hypothetical protein [Candidatus Obscuribacterales bacterium]